MIAGSQWQEKIGVILDAIREGLIFVDLGKKITLFNRAAEDLMGLYARDVIGRRVDELIPNTRTHIVLETGKAEMNQRQQNKFQPA